MNRLELSNQFDLLVSSYRRFRDFDNKEALDTIEFDEYEKSLFLTKAQEQLVTSLYDGKNPEGDSFENIEELRRYLAPLIKEAELPPLDKQLGANGYQPSFDNQTGITDVQPLDGATIVPNDETGITEIIFTPKPKDFIGVSDSSKFFHLPDDLWFITYEAALVTNGKCEGSTTLDVYPVRQDEYHKIKRNPFRGANDRRALRLDLANNVVEIVSKYGITSYYVRYMKKLQPIILEDMPNELTVNGINKATDCELHEGLHQKVLELAVAMALRSKGYNNENNENR